MNILHLAPHDYQGGASRIAWYLFNATKQRGINSMFAVGRKSLKDEQIIQIEQTKFNRFDFFRRLLKQIHLSFGWENFNYPATRYIPDMMQAQPDLLHAHNLQGKYFDLRVLPDLSSKYPLLLTLHDTWMLSGHCAYSIDCERWKIGCGKCPDLKRPPTIRRDASAYNWKKKKDIYSRSRVYLATPSQWLMGQVENSMLLPSVVFKKVIPNGVDTSVYRPTNVKEIRLSLGLDSDAFIALFVVSSRLKKNAYKDYSTVDQALSLFQDKYTGKKKVIFLGLGESAETQVVGNFEKRFIPYLSDSLEVAKYYQAADILLHAARADTFPNVVLESLACGTPVIATAVGGIPEQIINGKTGFLIPAQSSEIMAEKILELLNDHETKKEMSHAALEDVSKRFLLSYMFDAYLEYYAQIIEDFSVWKHV